MPSDFDPYAMLGVVTGASVDDIKNAYRKIARRLHPDSNRNHPGAAVQFSDITAAYELLSDPIRRRTYDERSRNRQDSNEFYFTLRITPSKRKIAMLNEPQVIYLLAEIFPDPRAASLGEKRDIRLNLTLVLDRSNSMNGARLEKVKVAAQQIIDNLTPNDILSVVVFNDRSEVVIPATTVRDKPALKARVSMMGASGGTEIFHGLQAGVEQNRVFRGPKLVNHIILLTDGRTFGDEEQCLALAAAAAKDGIGISAMGLGNEWNDTFLDQIAAKTGGTSEYINTAGAVVRFLNDHVRGLSNAFAERLKLSVAPDPDLQLELAFRLAPSPQQLEMTEPELPLGSLQMDRASSVLLQLQLPDNLDPGYRTIARLVAQGDILQNKNQACQSISDLSLEVTEKPDAEEPSGAILNALSKLTLYRLQERAQEALERGDIAEATKRLENLATRLLALGQSDLANQALQEAQRVAHTSGLSEQGRMTIKYQTRHLLLNSNNES
ncbi:MAG: VWA domain-containing protein [Anaerolineae bacterium]|nr:VWA domain-containing protein [Anaerolineae bacterium]